MPVTSTLVYRSAFWSPQQSGSFSSLNSKAENPHITVLPEESLAFLGVRNGGTYVDATLGAGGHAGAILAPFPDTKVIAFDRDPAAIELASKRLANYEDRLEIVHSNFSMLKSELEGLGRPAVDGIIADLGVSSMQLDDPNRGFSFKSDAPLDMRMDTADETETAADLLERLTETEIADVIYQLGEERYSRRIARRIVAAREAGEAVRTTGQLASLVRRSVPRRKNERVHPATKTFQALRIKVNDELEILERFIRDAVEVLKPSGRLVMITFHSLEDRIVKRTFQSLAGKCFCPRGFPECACGATEMVEIITRKPIVPSESEQHANPRSRSAKLRVCKKLDQI